jgi:tRNA-specific 2-thiouridylase
MWMLRSRSWLSLRQGSGVAERVVVAMSGGVDSSVAAALLVEQGYDVVGVMLRLWAEDAAALRVLNKCCSMEAVYDAQDVADRLGIPFYVVNAEQPFKEQVVDFFVAEYAAGRTPNPCLACNRKIRFGYLLNYARTLGARYLATGHYARVRRAADGRFQLCRGADRAKDQSYVLSVLGQADLAQALFPVGEYTKPQVRALAAERELPTASRIESQDLCFLADGDYRRFLAEQAPEAVQPGPILDTQGNQLGMHRGLPFYTIGQRSGLGNLVHAKDQAPPPPGGAATQPLYVVRLDMSRNALIVGRAAELGRAGFRTGQVNWVSGEPPDGPVQAEVQVRYRTAPVSAHVTPHGGGTVEVQLVRPLRDVTPGQAAVFYDGEVCLGNGLIAEVRTE